MFSLLIGTAALRLKNKRLALGLLAVLALTGCRAMQLQPTPDPTASPQPGDAVMCTAWSSAAVVWPLFEQYLHQQLELQRAAACSTQPAPLPQQ